MRTYLLGIIALLTACSEPSTEPTTTNHNSPLQQGHWIFNYDLNGTQVIQHASLGDSLRFTLHNHSENIKLLPTSLRGDSIYIEIPVYNTYFRGTRIDRETITGTWINPDKSSDYAVSFTAQYEPTPRILPSQIDQEYTYAVRFSPDSATQYPAVGRFAQSGNYLSGTFLTETGDYRFLEGQIEGDHLSLQCFDGSHLFHFDMQRSGKALQGDFRSGKHWQEPFSGTLDSSASLRNPFTITTLEKDTVFAFHALNLEGELVKFDAHKLRGKVTIIEIFGSWCPNCFDQAQYLKSIQSRYPNEQIEIIGVAFERSTDFETTVNRLNRYRKEMGIAYPLYIGGRASKSEANKVFPMLSCVCSFPTTLVVNQRGEISLIHTGFNGPSTGRAYTYFKSTFEAHLDSLVQAGILTAH